MAKGSDEKIDQLADDVIRDHRNLKRVISLLYDADMGNRLLGALAIGRIARLSPDIIKKRWNRIFYAFDDTMSCWGAAEALGEIGRNIPEMRSRIVLFLRRFEKDESACQGFIWAICRIGQVGIEHIKDFIPDLISLLKSREPCMAGQAIWTLGELKITEAMDKIKTFLNDNRQIWLYESDSVCIKTIGRIAKEAVEKMHTLQAV